jgi:tripartite-type tricarboxylate transporter receptor subunit TctC
MKSLIRFASALAVAVCSVLAQAQEPFPSRPLMLIVPYPPGGAVDAFARALADGLKQEWKTPVVIDNKPGANEVVGATALAKAKPDGYTVMASTEAASILNPLLFKKLPYDADKEIAPVSILVKAPLVLAVPANSPANSLKEFIEMARARGASNPVRYGSAGAGGTGHLPFVQLATDHRLSLIHAPYRGAGPMLQDLLGGHIEAGLLGTAVAEPQLKSGKLKGLAVTADKRLASLPTVPTYRELDIPDINSTFIVALSAPAGTPSDVIAAIGQAARRVLQSPGFQARTLDPFGFVAVGSDAATFADYIRQQRVAQKRRIDSAGIRLEP